MSTRLKAFFSWKGPPWRSQNTDWCDVQRLGWRLIHGVPGSHWTTAVSHHVISGKKRALIYLCNYWPTAITWSRVHTTLCIHRIMKKEAVSRLRRLVSLIVCLTAQDRQGSVENWFLCHTPDAVLRNSFADNKKTNNLELWSEKHRLLYIYHNFNRILPANLLFFSFSTHFTRFLFKYFVSRMEAKFSGFCTRVAHQWVVDLFVSRSKYTSLRFMLK